MRAWDQDTYEELIADNRFVGWVRGEDHSNEEYWRNWVKYHPLNVDESNEAVSTVKKLNFRGVPIDKSDIHYLWKKTLERIDQRKATSGVRLFVLKATRYAAILLFPVLILSVWLFMGYGSIEKKYSQLLESKQNQLIKIVAPIGARTEVDLPDGSKVWLNSGSQLTYPVAFSNEKRVVSLQGEAYFKVQKDKIPFVVDNLGPSIKVYGTEFNVNSYADEDVVSVALVEGKVSLDLNGKEEFLNPGQISVFDRKKNSISINQGDVEVSSVWREGKYVFRDTPLSSILRILQRQHNITIRLLNPELGGYRYNATIDNESLEQILQLLSMSAPIKYDFKHKTLNQDGSYTPDQIEISVDQTKTIKN